MKRPRKKNRPENLGRRCTWSFPDFLLLFQSFILAVPYGLPAPEFVDHLQQIGYWHESDSSIGCGAAILSQVVLLFEPECYR
jgi:hypothetical protein